MSTADYLTSGLSLLKAAGLLYVISILTTILGEYQVRVSRS